MIARYLESLKVHGSPPATLSTYRRVLLGFRGPIDEWTWRDIDQWNIANADELAGSTRRLHISVLSAYYAWCIDEGLRSDNPAKLLPKKRRPRKNSAKKKAMPWADVKKLLAVDVIRSDGHSRPITNDERLLVQILAWTGVRVHEAIAIETENINLKAGTIYLGKTKTGEPRYAYVFPRLRPILRTIAGDPCTGLFPATCNTDWARRTMTRVARAAGIGHTTPHMLRHALATHLIEIGGTLAQVQQIMGHANIQTTINVYGHLSVKKAGEALAKVI